MVEGCEKLGCQFRETIRQHGEWFEGIFNRVRGVEYVQGQQDIRLGEAVSRIENAAVLVDEIGKQLSGLVVDNAKRQGREVFWRAVIGLCCAILGAVLMRFLGLN